MMRLFIGLGLSQGARDALSAAVRSMGIRGRLVPGNNYHLTVAFLGERDERQAQQVKRIIAAAAKGHPPMTLAVSGLGFFGRRENALLYAALAPCAALPPLPTHLRRLLQEAGEAFDEKPFAAHITLARMADVSGTDLRIPLPPIAFAVRQLTLYHSVRAQGELRYLPIYNASLEGDANPV
jgi:RNA 2',3'-cyclic 3'-phosphodiesterase